MRLRLIGDVVFTTPLIGALRRRFPDARLTYVVEPAAAPVVRRNPHLDDVIELPMTSGFARLAGDAQVARRLAASRVDIALDLHGGPRSAWLTWGSRAPMRVGYAITGRSWMYTHVVPRPAGLTARHSVENQWDLLEPLGIAAPDPARDPVIMADDPDAVVRVQTLLDETGIGTRPVVVLHVSAGNPFRRWPPEAFEALIERLVRRDPERRIVITSGPSEAAAARVIASGARARLGALAAAVPPMRELDLPELRTLVARAALYIGGDSGPLHIAATTRTPIVALLGPTLPERSMPWRDPAIPSAAVDMGALPCRPCHQRTCEPGDFRCLTAITPERVAEAAERLLSAP